MPKITISVCEQCGDSFTIDLSKCELLPGMRPKIRKQDDAPHPIKTWADWIDHISHNCPNCRYSSPPPQAQQDLEHLKEKRRS